MSHLYLWQGLHKIIVTFETSEPCAEVRKICHVNTHMFALTKSHSLYCGKIENGEDSYSVPLKKTNISAIDISCNKNSLYFVNDVGQVFRTTESLDTYEEIVLKEDAKCCVHGYKTPGHKVKVKNVSVSDTSCLFVTESGQLWASGNHPQLSIQGSEPKKVTFFEKRCVLSVTSGADFHLALVFKPLLCAQDKDRSDSDDEDDDGEVFVSSCVQCVNESISSPISTQSMSDICPLGLPIVHSNEEQYSSSTASKDNSADDKKSTDDSTSLSTEDKTTQQKCSSNCNETVNANVEPSDKQALSEDICTTLVNGSDEVEHEVPSKTEGEPTTDQESETDSLKEERKNEFFINTDAARQFLTRQLSWVSSYGGAGEDLLVECAEASLVRPTRMLKQNVSNMASLVYEGVKTVGDRVATLSRHMSGGSETSDGVSGGLLECESFEDLSEECKPAAPSVASSLRFEEFPWSSSTGTSERGEGSDLGIADRIHEMARRGNALLNPELWSWGGAAYGQLGLSDTGKRSRPVLISRLTGLGVRKIVSGRYHSLAVTLDGRAFAWGRNSARQVTLESAQDQSTPQPLTFVTERVKDVGAGDSHSIILSHPGALYFIGKNGSDSLKSLVKVSFESDQADMDKLIFSSNKLSGCVVRTRPISSIVQDLTIEQSFLEEALLINTALIKPVQKKGTIAHGNNVYEVLCSCYGDIVSFTALNVYSFWEYVNKGGQPSDINFVYNVEEFVKVYRNYLNASCDIISLSGFTHLARIIDVPQKLFVVFSERLQLKKSKKSGEAIVTCALLQPLDRLHVYKCMIQSLMKYNLDQGDTSEIKQAQEKRLQEALSKWEQLWEEQDRRKREADTTRQFWESAGKLTELLRSPERRLVRESRSHPIFVSNSGRFSSHWFVLLTDILIHVTGGSQVVHPVQTIWVEPLQDTDTLQNALLLTMPEEVLTVYTPTPQDKTEWLQALHGSIKKSLFKCHSHVPPTARTANYTFTKHPQYKDAKYTGRWFSGKLQGPGKLEWVDGRTYVGHFQNNQSHGFGRMDTPGVSVYEGQWRDGLQNGFGITKYENGDVYEGHFKDGHPNGHGIHKQGHFMASMASVYIGEWVNGVKQGYGVMDDIVTGEKYLGCWSNNLKHGCGLIVTLDGIYYEGIFMQDILTGHGVMVFEDETHYEGEFRSAGIFNGKGTLTFSGGDLLEGSMYGAWNEGIKVTGTLVKNTVTPPSKMATKPSSFGKLCVNACQKWKAIFRQCYQQLGITEPTLKSSMGMTKLNADVQKVWENIAVCITNSHQENQHRLKGGRVKDGASVDKLDTIPQFGKESIDKESYQDIRKYLLKAFESLHHPLGLLLSDLTTAYTATYGGVRVHPLLLSHAVAELHSITTRVYEVVRLMFPALPPTGQELLLGEGQTEHDSEVVSSTTLLHPVLLPRVHSALFVLYALHNKMEDDAYWKRLLKWNKQPDITLMAFLGIDQKFWVGYPQSPVARCLEAPFTPVRDQLFNDAVETLQQLKTTFSPLEKLQVIRSTFQQMTTAVQQELGTSYLWSMDDLFPVFHFVVVRSRILQLGSEIHFVEDFMEPYLQNGELGIMFTTLKACYYQILQEKISMSS